MGGSSEHREWLVGVGEVMPMKWYVLGLCAVLALCPACQSTPSPESTDAAKTTLGSWPEPGSTPKPKTLPTLLTEFPWQGGAAAVDLHMLQHGFPLVKATNDERKMRFYIGSITGASDAAVAVRFVFINSVPKQEWVTELTMHVPVSGRLFDAYRDMAWELEKAWGEPTKTDRNVFSPEDRQRNLSDLLEEHKVSYWVEWGNVSVHVNDRERRIELSCFGPRELSQVAKKVPEAKK
ncbi:MAG: hypothetical protein H6Q86_5479 [candidate division NC10 bacterium]|nr:hypothetical protein [candidate division NC10 bacterium]